MASDQISESLIPQGQERVDAGIRPPPFRALRRNPDCFSPLHAGEDKKIADVTKARSPGCGVAFSSWFWRELASGSGPAVELNLLREANDQGPVDSASGNLRPEPGRYRPAVLLAGGHRSRTSREAKRGEEMAPVAQVRDTILSVLAEAKVDELMTAAGKTKLKEDLLHALQERVPQLGVEEVYFTEFLIQR